MLCLYVMLFSNGENLTIHRCKIVQYIVNYSEEKQYFGLYTGVLTMIMITQPTETIVFLWECRKYYLLLELKTNDILM